MREDTSTHGERELCSDTPLATFPATSDAGLKHHAQPEGPDAQPTLGVVNCPAYSMRKGQCCFIPCDANAEWEFYTQGTSETCHACDTHLAQLLEDGTSIVYPIPVEMQAAVPESQDGLPDYDAEYYEIRARMAPFNGNLEMVAPMLQCRERQLIATRAKLDYFVKLAHENERNGLRMRDEGNAKITTLQAQIANLTKAA